MLERACGLHCELRPLQGRRQTIGAHCWWGWGGAIGDGLHHAPDGSGSPLLILPPPTHLRADFGLVAAPVSVVGARDKPVGRHHGGRSAAGVLKPSCVSLSGREAFGIMGGALSPSDTD
jgi:hypothetical protein